jgi:carbon starvation protein
MESVLIMVVAFVGYLVAYRTYGRHLAFRVFRLDPERVTPAHTEQDGVDYVPTRRQIIFGHHFTSIAGTGPIVGPAIGIIWGWLPALLWVFVGAVFMGAVHDFGSLVVSLRHRGRSLAEITGVAMNRHLRLIFFTIVFMVLLIVIAIFGLVIAVLFSMYPQSVFPVWMEIPIAVLLGWFVYRRGAGLVVSTAIAVGAMYATVILGHYLPLTMPAIGGLPPTGVWTVVLLLYAFIASTLPVTTLLQPRDFINAWQLFIAMGLLILGVLAARPQLVAPAFNPAPPGAPDLLPFLFITIACGAVSGFHSLVAGGTSAKQVSHEPDAQMVGYGSMLTESFLAVLVIIACGAGLGMEYHTADGAVLTGSAAFGEHYATWGAAKGLGSKVAAFVVGSANMIAVLGIPSHLGIVIMGVFVASFAGTTLDTATRIQRYVIAELATDLRVKPLTNRYVATAVAVLTAAALAFYNGASGAGALALWPLFGAINQLLAGLSLIIISYYLRQQGRNCLYTLIPAVLVLGFTAWALSITLADMYAAGNVPSVIIGALALVLEVWLTVEALLFIARPRPASQSAG